MYGYDAASQVTSITYTQGSRPRLKARSADALREADPKAVRLGRIKRGRDAALPAHRGPGAADSRLTSTGQVDLQTTTELLNRAGDHYIVDRVVRRWHEQRRVRLDQADVGELRGGVAGAGIGHFRQHFDLQLL